MAVNHHLTTLREASESCFRREGQRRPKAWLFLLRGRTGTAFSGEAPHQGRGAANCSQRGETAGAVAEGIARQAIAGRKNYLSAAAFLPGEAGVVLTDAERV